MTRIFWQVLVRQVNADLKVPTEPEFSISNTRKSLR